MADKEDIGPSSSLKRNVSCFGKAFLSWNSKHLLGIHRDLYSADSDINVRVNYFLNTNPPRKNYSQSKGKSNTCAK